eukprot:3681852-Pyramimonas_sp.AAC.1
MYKEGYRLISHASCSRATTASSIDKLVCRVFCEALVCNPAAPADGVLWARGIGDERYGGCP